MNKEEWIEWAIANPEKAKSWTDYQTEETRRKIAKHVLDEQLPSSLSIFERLARDGIIPPEMVDALYDESRDPLDRQATFDRIMGMAKDYYGREQEKHTIQGKLDKLLSMWNQARPQTTQMDGLSIEYKEIAALLTQGYNRKEIAQRTGFSTETIKQRLYSISEQWGLERTSRVGTLAAEARRRGYG